MRTEVHEMLYGQELSPNAAKPKRFFVKKHAAGFEAPELKDARDFERYPCCGGTGQKSKVIKQNFKGKKYSFATCPCGGDNGRTS